MKVVQQSVSSKLRGYSQIKNGVEDVRTSLLDVTQKTNSIYAYNINNGLRKWRLAKSRLDNGIIETINVNIIGDSISEGFSGLTNLFLIIKKVMQIY
jgi:hypothetical protein